MPSATTSLAVLVADTGFVTGSQDLVIAEERSATGHVQANIAATVPLITNLGVLVAGGPSVTCSLDASLSGSLYLSGLLSLSIAEHVSIETDVDLAVAAANTLTPSLDISLTDSLPIVLEPNAPKSAPLVTMSDLWLGSHANLISSPTTDFASIGVRYRDVLEIYDGPNAGHYIVQSVVGNALFVGEAFIAPSSPGPWSGEIRSHRSICAQTTVALVIDQALFIAPTVRQTMLEIVIA